MVSGTSFQTRRLWGAIVGGLLAGLVLSVWMLVGEVVAREPSQLVVMERQIAGWLGSAPPVDPALVSGQEEYLGNLGHLLLSVAAGAVYPLAFRRHRHWVLTGLLFGAGFFVAAHAIVGPLLGLTPGMWNMPWAVFLTGCVINGFFGLCTALLAHVAEGEPPARTRG